MHNISAQDAQHYSQKKKTVNINFGLEMKEIAKNIEYISIYLELKCVETNKSYKTTNNFGSHQVENKVYFPLAELKRIETFKQLTFIGCID